MNHRQKLKAALVRAGRTAAMVLLAVAAVVVGNLLTAVLFPGL